MPAPDFITAVPWSQAGTEGAIQVQFLGVHGWHHCWVLRPKPWNSTCIMASGRCWGIPRKAAGHLEIFEGKGPSQGESRRRLQRHCQDSAGQYPTWSHGQGLCDADGNDARRSRKGLAEKPGEGGSGRSWCLGHQRKRRLRRTLLEPQGAECGPGLRAVGSELRKEVQAQNCAPPSRNRKGDTQEGQWCERPARGRGTAQGQGWRSPQEEDLGIVVPALAIFPASLWLRNAPPRTHAHEVGRTHFVPHSSF